MLKLCALIQYTLASQIMSRLPFLTMTCRGRDDNRLRYTLKKQKAIVNCKASIWASPDLISQEKDDGFNPSTRPSWCSRLKGTARNTTGHLVRYMDAPFTYSRVMTVSCRTLTLTILSTQCHELLGPRTPGPSCHPRLSSYR